MLKDRISDSFLFLHSVDISYEVLNIHDEDVSCCIKVSVHNPSTEGTFEDFVAPKFMVKSATASAGFGGVMFRNFMNSASLTAHLCASTSVEMHSETTVSSSSQFQNQSF